MQHPWPVVASESPEQLESCDRPHKEPNLGRPNTYSHEMNMKYILRFFAHKMAKPLNFKSGYFWTKFFGRVLCVKIISYILCMLNLKLIRLSYAVLQQRRFYSCVGKVHTGSYIKRTAIQWQVGQMARDRSRNVTYMFSFIPEWLWSLVPWGICTINTATYTCLVHYPEY